MIGFVFEKDAYIYCMIVGCICYSWNCMMHTNNNIRRPFFSVRIYTYTNNSNDPLDLVDPNPVQNIFRWDVTFWSPSAIARDSGDCHRTGTWTNGSLYAGCHLG